MGSIMALVMEEVMVAVSGVVAVGVGVGNGRTKEQRST